MHTDPGKQAGFSKIGEVTNVVVTRLDGSRLLVQAKGRVPSSGWSLPRLTVTSNPGAPKTTLAFEGWPPEGPTTQVITQLSGDCVLREFPEAVRVTADQNEIVVPASQFVKPSFA